MIQCSARKHIDGAAGHTCPRAGHASNNTTGEDILNTAANDAHIAEHRARNVEDAAARHADECRRAAGQHVERTARNSRSRPDRPGDRSA